LKKAKFHYGGRDYCWTRNCTRYNLGCLDGDSGNMEQALKHCMIAASAGNYRAMQNLIEERVSRESIVSTLTAYNNSCAEMRREARDAFIRLNFDHIVNVLNYSLTT